jgi:hypothetical protein
MPKAARQSGHVASALSQVGAPSSRWRIAAATLQNATSLVGGNDMECRDFELAALPTGRNAEAVVLSRTRSQASTE